MRAPVCRHDVLFDDAGRIQNWEALKDAVRAYGVANDPVSRRILYPFLLGVFEAGSTRVERAGVLRRLRHVHAKLVFACERLGGEQRGEELGEEKAGDDNIHCVRMTSTSEAPSGSEYEGTVNVSSEGTPSPTLPSPLPLPHASSPLPLTPHSSLLHASFHEAHRLIVIDAVRTDLLDLEVCGDWDASVFWSAVFGNATSRNDRRWGKSETSNTSGHGTTGGTGDGPTDSKTHEGRGQRQQQQQRFVGDGLPELMQVHSPLPKPSQQVASGMQPIWTSEFASATIDASCKSHTRHTRRQMVRLINLLSIYAVHDPENGYCQGMSDLGAVFVAIESDDALAFACFEALMRTARENFRHDEWGMKSQLAVVREIVKNTDGALYKKLQVLGGAECMFVHRMVVVLMRRDLPVNEALRLWEMCWAYGDRGDVGSLGDGRGGRDGRGESRRSSGGEEDDEDVEFEIRSTLRSTVLRKDDRRYPPKTVPRSKAPSWRGTPTGDDDRQHDPPQDHNKPTFFLQFVASVIKEHRKHIITECSEYDDLMRHFNGVHIDFEATVARARRRHTAYEQGATLIQSLMN